MYIKIVLYSCLSIIVLVAIILTLSNRTKTLETDIIATIVQVLKLIMPIFALISLFRTNLDKTSYLFVVYLSIYYVFDAFISFLYDRKIQNALEEFCQLKYPKKSTSSFIVAASSIYWYLLHILLLHTIQDWNSLIWIRKTLCVIGLFLLVIYSLLCLISFVYDISSFICFYLINRKINKIIKAQSIMTFEQCIHIMRTIINLIAYAGEPSLADEYLEYYNIIKKCSKESKKKQLHTDTNKTFLEIFQRFQNTFLLTQKAA